MMSALPVGTVTFLFTDIEGSTRLLQRLGDRYSRVLADQRSVLRAAFERHSGQEVDTQGDAFFVSFPRASHALAAAVEIQRALAEHPWPDAVEVRVRIGLHTGEPGLAGEGYTGIDVHRAARIAHAGHGGQTLLSETTALLARDELPEGVRLRDLGEFHLKDLARPERIYQLDIAALPSKFPPLSVPARAPDNLPRHLSPFVGRRREIAQVIERVNRGRLVTLVGPGGVGKTRLSIEVASRVAGSFPQGVWFVELAPLQDPSLLAQTVGQVLGVREEASQPTMATLIELLRLKSTLLVLDNCEHVIEACAELVSTISTACREVRILASSREALSVPGEVVYSVPSLAVADPDELPDLAELREIESVHLFLDRVRAFRSDFALDSHNAPAIAQICKRLDGIPLAIELAASRVRVLSVDQIATRLDDRFNLLTGGLRTALPRHQTLRATIDWSYQLLSEAERTLFRRLSVFVGGWTLEAAEAVCADPDQAASQNLPPGKVLELLAQLVDKSLVMKEDREGAARFHRLETVRRYALDKLVESDEVEDLRNRHLEWFLAFAETAEPHLDGPEQVEWLMRLDRERDNLRAALEWCQQSIGRTESGLRLASAITNFWYSRGNFSEMRVRLKALLSAPHEPVEGAARAKALATAADLAYRQSDFQTTSDLFAQSLEIYRSLGESGRHGMAIALIGLGNVATEVGDYESAPELFEEGLALMRQIEDHQGIAHALRNLGWCAMRPGDYALAEDYLEQALDQFRQLGDSMGIASTLSGLGEVAIRQGAYESAQELLTESLSLRRQLGNKWGIAASLGSLGWVALRQGDIPGARAHLAESLGVRTEIDDVGGIAWCLERLAEAAGEEGEIERQVRVFGAAAALRESVRAVIDPADQPAYEATLDAARTTLGERAFVAAWDAGRRLTRDEAIAHALGENTGT